MPRYIAFLRAINVGGHVVKMERLRGLFAELGFTQVETFIASGNVLFQTRSTNPSALEKKIEQRLREALGYEVATMLRTTAELSEIAAAKVFGTDETKDGSVYIAFLRSTPTKAAAETLTGHEGKVDEFRIRGREIYWLCRERFSDSKFSGKQFEKILGQPTTVRNSTTVRKLAAKLSAA